MSKKTKIWLISAASLVVIGCLIIGGTMAMLKWDFEKLSTVKFETNNYDINEDYKNISVITNTADIVFISTENAESSVVCYEEKNMKHTVAIKDDTLVIEVIDTRKWYEYIGITIGTPKISIYLPQKEYNLLSVKNSTGDIEIPKNITFQNIDINSSTGDVECFASVFEDLKIKLSTGDISIENISAGSLDLSLSTGKVDLSTIDCKGDIKVKVSTGKTKFGDITCKNVISNGSTGDIILKNVIATEKFSIKRSTGDVRFEGCDAAELLIKTDTGYVKGSLLSDKVFIAQTDTGRVDVPKTVAGGRCEITTDTGDISITINK